MFSAGSRGMTLVPDRDEANVAAIPSVWGERSRAVRGLPLRTMGAAALIALGLIGFVSLPRGGGETSTSAVAGTIMLASVKTLIDAKFRIVENPDSTVAIMCKDNKYLSAQEDGTLALTNGGILDPESWTLTEESDDMISLKSTHGKYLSVGSDGECAASGEDAGDKETFRRHKYADGTSSFTNQKGDRLSVHGLKTIEKVPHPGRYAAYTRKVKAGTQELFHVEKGSTAGTIAIKSLTHGTFLSVDDDGSITSVSESVGEKESFKLVAHKTKFKKIKIVSLKSVNGLYVAAMPNGTVKANAPAIKGWEYLKLVPLHHGAVFIASLHNQYLTVSLSPISTFYMYRAEQEHGRPWENVNTGNLGGVLWYVHNEVVVENPRKYSIARIVRKRFQMATPPALIEKGQKFGVRFAYDTGMCTGAGPINGWASCRDSYAKYGNFVGCNYLGDYPFPMTSKGFGTFYLGGIWYSLPKEGHCFSAPTGHENCTYSYDDAGYLDISALYDEPNYWVWANDKTHIEYDKATDKGSGTNFFDHLYDAAANKKRVETAMQKFNEKYPDMAKEENMQNPVCDFQCQRFYTEEELQKVGAECRCSEREVAKHYYTDVGPDECKLNSQKDSGKLQDMGYYAGKAT